MKPNILLLFKLSLLANYQNRLLYFRFIYYRNTTLCPLALASTTQPLVSKIFRRRFEKIVRVCFHHVPKSIYSIGRTSIERLLVHYTSVDLVTAPGCFLNSPPKNECWYGIGLPPLFAILSDLEQLLADVDWNDTDIPLSKDPTLPRLCAFSPVTTLRS